MATPPVPPRPAEFYDPQGKASAPAPPPVPPLPPTFRQDQVQSPSFSSPPHFEDPLVAPRPHKLQPDLSANVRTSFSHPSFTQILITTLTFNVDGPIIARPSCHCPPSWSWHRGISASTTIFSFYESYTRIFHASAKSSTYRQSRSSASSTRRRLVAMGYTTGISLSLSSSSTTIPSSASTLPAQPISSSALSTTTKRRFRRHECICCLVCRLPCPAASSH